MAPSCSPLTVEGSTATSLRAELGKVHVSVFTIIFKHALILYTTESLLCMCW